MRCRSGVSITSARSIAPERSTATRRSTTPCSSLRIFSGRAAAQGLDVELGVGHGADLTVVGLTEQVPLDSQNM
jgi:hypothetical protein